MCKILFIGTQNELQEIPLDEKCPDLHLEKISGELLPVKHVFKIRMFISLGQVEAAVATLEFNQINLTQHQLDRYRQFKTYSIDFAD